VQRRPHDEAEHDGARQHGHQADHHGPTLRPVPAGVTGVR
jgi:hypothetical protein